MEEKKLLKQLSHFARLKVQKEVVIQIVTSQSYFGRRTEVWDQEPEEMKWLAARFKKRAEMVIDRQFDSMIG